MLIVAVNAHTGEPVVFDRHSGVELVDAVAVSCANGFGVLPYCIGGNRTSTVATGATRIPIWLPDMGGCWCCHGSGNAFGSDLMDLPARPPSARADYNAGRAVAERLTKFWR